MSILTESQINRINQMLGEGRSIEEISRVCKVSPVQIALIATQKTNISEKPLPEASKPSTAILPKPDKSVYGDIIVGYTDSLEPVFWNPINSPNPHLMIVGESGFGKTYGITGLICELSKINLPTIIIDYSKSYSTKNFPDKFRKPTILREINVSKNGISLNPLDIRSSDERGPLSVAVRVSETFNRIYRIGVHQAALLRDVIIDVYKKKGIYEKEQKSWAKQAPYLSDINSELISISEDEEDSRHNSADKTRSHISNFFVYNTFNAQGSNFNWNEAMGSNKITILQLSGLEGKIQKVITEFLLWDLYAFISHQGESKLKCFLVLDEAHNLKFDPGTPVDKIVREARKFGLAAILASQQPEDFSGPVFSSTGTKICFQVAEEKGKFVQRIASKCNKSQNEVRQILSTLPKAHAFLLSKNTGYICRIASFEERGLI